MKRESLNGDFNCMIIIKSRFHNSKTIIRGNDDVLYYLVNFQNDIYKLLPFNDCLSDLELKNLLTTEYEFYEKVKIKKEVKRSIRKCINCGNSYLINVTNFKLRHSIIYQALERGKLVDYYASYSSLCIPNGCEKNKLKMINKDQREKIKIKLSQFKFNEIFGTLSFGHKNEAYYENMKESSIIKNHPSHKKIKYTDLSESEKEIFNKIKKTEKMLKIHSLIIFLVCNQVLSQLPILDNFNSIGGTNQWQINHGFLYEDVNMGVENGYLTYNTGFNNYLDAKQYEFVSPDYTTLFKDCGCDSIKVTLKVDMNIRKFDQFKLFYILNPTSYNFKIISTSGTYSYTLPSNLKGFTLSFITWGGNTLLTGKYVHIDYFNIECVAHPLPVTLLNFDVKANGLTNYIHWSTAAELNSDYFSLEKSYNCVDFNEVYRTFTGPNSSEIKNYEYYDREGSDIVYYRLKQVDLNGSEKILGIKSIMNKNDDEVIKIINVLGQEVTSDYRGLKFYIMESNNNLKIW